jgi:hypothetical protein
MHHRQARITTMDLPIEYRARMMGAAADALSEELRELRLWGQAAVRVVDLLDQLRMNAAAIARETGRVASPSQIGEPIRPLSSSESNVVPLRRPA